MTQRSRLPGCDGSSRSAADEHRIDAGGLERRRMPVTAVDELHARRVGEQLDRLALGHRARERAGWRDIA